MDVEAKTKKAARQLTRWVSVRRNLENEKRQYLPHILIVTNFN